jgi:predicted DCC family thiol-disulfide oxidoreductase YuxK
MTGILVYDADCGFCTRAAKWAERHLRDGGRVAASYTLDQETVGLTQAQLDEQAWWLDEDGSQLGGHEAIAAAMKDCGQPYRAAGIVLGSRPLRPIARRAYALTARNRHRLPGSDGTCGLDAPPPGDQTATNTK